MESIDNLCFQEQQEYCGIMDCEDGLPCATGQSQNYYSGYALAYANEQVATARSIANGN